MDNATLSVDNATDLLLPRKWFPTYSFFLGFNDSDQALLFQLGYYQAWHWVLLLEWGFA